MQAPVELAMLSTAVFLGGLVSGFSGFAFSAAAGAILLHVFEPIAAIPLMMFCSIASQTMSLVKVYRLIRWRELAPLLIGGMAGAAVAVPSWPPSTRTRSASLSASSSRATRSTC